MTYGDPPDNEIHSKGFGTHLAVRWVAYLTRNTKTVQRRDHSKRPMRIYLQTLYRPGQPIRFYQLDLQPDLLGGWILARESGLQGGRGQVTKMHFARRDEAERKLIQFRDQQLEKGYRVVFCKGIQLESE